MHVTCTQCGIQLAPPLSRSQVGKPVCPGVQLGARGPPVLLPSPTAPVPLLPPGTLACPACGHRCDGCAQSLGSPASRALPLPDPWQFVGAAPSSG